MTPPLVQAGKSMIGTAMRFYWNFCQWRGFMVRCSMLRTPSSLGMELRDGGQREPFKDEAR